MPKIECHVFVFQDAEAIRYRFRKTWAWKISLWVNGGARIGVLKSIRTYNDHRGAGTAARLAIKRLFPGAEPVIL